MRYRPNLFMGKGSSYGTLAKNNCKGLHQYLFSPHQHPLLFFTMIFPLEIALLMYDKLKSEAIILVGVSGF